jgi:hypothetical protein
MNRLSFLKTMGVGIAAAVITPKILAELPPPTAVPSEKDKEWGKKWAEECYSMWKKDKELGVDSLRLWDSVMNRDEEIYVVTGRCLDTIELTAIDTRTQPNFLDITKDKFGEYFIIIGSAFNEGTGVPK